MRSTCSPHPKERRPSAFTLVEILITVTVLAVLLVLVSQLMNQTTIITTLSTKRLDAAADARVVFARLLDDIDGLVLRHNIDCFFVKNTGASKNDAMYFYSQSPSFLNGDPHPGADINSPFAFIGYRVANRAAPTTVYPNQMLERTGIRLKYNDDGAWALNSTWNLVSLVRPAPTLAVPSPLPMENSTLPSIEGYNIGAPPNWDNSAGTATLYGRLSPQVFRFEFCFLLKDGKYFVPPAPGNTPWTNSSFCDAMLKIRTDATALIVTIALLDPTSRILAPDLTRAIAALDDGIDPTVAKLWTDKINNGTFAQTTGIPITAASQVRVFQRSFRLPAR